MAQGYGLNFGGVCILPLGRHEITERARWFDSPPAPRAIRVHATARFRAWDPVEHRVLVGTLFRISVTVVPARCVAELTRIPASWVESVMTRCGDVHVITLTPDDILGEGFGRRSVRIGHGSTFVRGTTSTRKRDPPFRTAACMAGRNVCTKALR